MGRNRSMATEVEALARADLALDWAEVTRLVLRSRALDELEERELAPTGEVPYQFSSRGHELAQVLLAIHLNHPHDAAGVYYRSRPFMLAAGLTPRGTPRGGAWGGRGSPPPPAPRPTRAACLGGCGGTVHAGRGLGAGHP